jgi:hypothetical protein
MRRRAEVAGSGVGAGVAAAFSLALGVALLGPAPVLAQSGGVHDLAAACAQGRGEAATLRCADAALAAHAIQGGLGLLVAAGGAYPVSPSTAGHRLEGSPRIVVDGGTTFGSFRHPDLSGSDGGAAPDRRTMVWAGRITAGAGIFEGFSAAPTVGGIGSLDAVATLRVMALPSSRGISGSAASAGAGLRVGILRESFSLPGVTLTGMVHRLGTIRHGDLDDAGAQVTVGPRVTSLRLETGKDMLALGVTGGAGLDRISGEAEVSVVTEGGEVGSTSPVRLRQTRRYLFAGVNYTWLVTQLAGELAWSPGRELSTELQGTGPFQPGSSNLQGTLTFRILY